VRVLMPVPDCDFDVTEVAVTWHILRSAGHEVAFATERAGIVPRAALDDPGRQFKRGPRTLTARGSATDHASASVVQDRNYVSARWPGDEGLRPAE